MTTAAAVQSQDRLIDKIGRFVAISHTFVEDMPNLSPASVKLFLYLRFRANNQTDEAFPSYDAISKDTGLARATISEGIKGLIERGWLKKKRRFSNSTIYEICNPSISSEIELMDDKNEPPLVQKLNCISSEIELPLVQKLNSNKNQSTRTKEQHHQAQTLDKVANANCDPKDDDDDDFFKQIKSELSKQNLVMTPRTIKAAKRLATSKYAIEIIRAEAAKVAPTSKSRTGVLLTALERFDIITYTPPVKETIKIRKEY